MKCLWLPLSTIMAEAVEVMIGRLTFLPCASRTVAPLRVTTAQSPSSR